MLDNVWTVQEVASFYSDNIHVFVSHFSDFKKYID